MKYYIIFRGDNKNTRHAKKSLRRKIKRKGRLADTNRSQKSGFSRRRYSSDLERFISINKKKTSAKDGKNLVLNDDFSLFNNPSSTLYNLACFLRYTKSNSSKSRLLYKGNMSFGAVYLLDSLCWRIAERKDWELNTTELPEEDKLFFMNLKSYRDKKTENAHSYLVNARVRINRLEHLLKKQLYEAKSKEIRDLVQKGIQEKFDEEFVFSRMHNTALNSAITEHFDNIFQHAKKAKYGNLCGYYNRVHNEVRIIIYNFGETIYENLSQGNLPHDMQAKIDEVMKSHTKKKLFSLERGFTEENALTLLALQEGISSKLSDDKSRGHGLIDFIEHCFKLSEESKIRIISGSTAILIDKRYRISTKFFSGRERRVLALNQNNELLEPPDKTYVEKMSIFFPGVIIETLIPLNELTNHGHN